MGHAHLAFFFLLLLLLPSYINASCSWPQASNRVCASTTKGMPSALKTLANQLLVALTAVNY
jgi:hypothetical protein